MVRLLPVLERKSARIAGIVGSISSAGELFKPFLQCLKIDPPYSLSRAKPLFYTAVAEAKRKPLVLIDDAQDAAPEALLALKSMTNFDADSSNRITFILAGQPDLRTILAYAHFDALRTRIRLTHKLVPMSLEETAGYIDHGLQIVHCKEKLFSDKAKMAVFKRSAGIARTVNTICYQAILRFHPMPRRFRQSPGGPSVWRVVEITPGKVWKDRLAGNRSGRSSTLAANGPSGLCHENPASIAGFSWYNDG